MRKLIMVAVIAAVLAIAGALPAFGQAYGGQPGLTCFQDTVVGDHFPPNTTPTVFVDGQVSGQAQVSNDGSFTFPLPSSTEPGDHTVTVEGSSVRATCTVAEVAGITVVKTPPGGTAFTGASILTPGLIAIGLFVLGAVSLLAARRRRRPRAVRSPSGGEDPTS